MLTAEEHNLNKASNHVEQGLTRLQTIRLGNTDLLTESQQKMIDAYRTHLADIKKSIDQIQEDVAEQREKLSVTT